MSNYPIETNLKDGTPVLIRLMGLDDKEDLKIGFDKLSVNSRYCRFFAPMRNLSDGQLKYLTEIDNKSHLALCVYDISGDHMIGIGVARYIRIDDEPETAEFALTIIDEYQNRGLGTKLLNLLIQTARENGICKLIGYVLNENSSMLRILKHFDAQIRKEDSMIQRVDLTLSP
ncbi:MAG: GNAT family N-acetyltransferase [bacterium]|nr:MAG: GNAT family N-acetyltransferase [bacterium]